MAVAPLSDLAARAGDGDVVALGGKTLHRAPMALVRALARAGTTDLTLVGLANSMDADLLCGTGDAAAIHYGYVGFEALGLAPNYRRAVEGGDLDAREGTCYTVATMLRAATQGVPFLPVAGLEESDLPAVNDALGETACPFTGESTAAVRAVRPDVTLVHAAEADPDGNLRLGGADLTESLAAAAGDVVLATAERVVDPGTFVERPGDTDVPAHLVDAVAEVPYGAHPCACPGEYDYDAAHLREYLDRSKDGAFAAWADEFLAGDESAYRERAVAGRTEEFAWDGADAPSPPAGAEP
ncbi:MAG: CoA transferase subunit A [Haloferacaceae archaeon]